MFTEGGAVLHNGDRLPADLIVLATGYKGQEHLAEKLFGAAVAERVGPIWGFGDRLELRNMYVRSTNPASGSSPAASLNAGSIPNIWGCN